MRTIEEVVDKIAETPKNTYTVFTGFCSKCNCWFYSYTRKAAFCSRRCGHLVDGCITHDGYKVIRVNGKLIPEHRYLIQEHLGRILLRSEDVHHINEDKLDNRIENLQVLSKSDHAKLHHDNNNLRS